MSNNEQILVEVTGLSKKFSRNLKRSLWYGLKDVMNTVLGISGNRSRLRKDEFWAVKGVGFSVRRGECVGLVGRNGAGKSTLLKMLNGLIVPDEGSIVIRGKVGALIELGAGFNPILTGRENIYVNGEILGFSRKEIDARMKAILDFAEIGDFIDSPVQNYSSGMKVRLGFAVAAQMEPDVLIIDEVLAVGDLGFVLKCFSTIDTLLQKAAVIFVSHSMPQVSRICSHILVMEQGEVVFSGPDVSGGIDLYYSKFSSGPENNVVFNRNDDASLVRLELGEKSNDNGNGKAVYGIQHLDDLVIRAHLKVRSFINNPSIAITILDKEQRPVGVCINEQGLSGPQVVGQEADYTSYQVRLVLSRINLSKGIYSIALSVAEKYNAQPILRLQSVAKFQVYSKNDVWPPVEFEGAWS